MKRNFIAYLLLLPLLILNSLSTLGQENPISLQVKIQELYIGILGRAADWAGLQYWENQIEAGPFTLENTRAAFTDPAQAEYTQIYGGLGNTQLVTATYENFLERIPEEAGLVYWVAELDNARVNPDQMINAVISAARTVAGIADRGVGKVLPIHELAACSKTAGSVTGRVACYLRTIVGRQVDHM